MTFLRTTAALLTTAFLMVLVTSVSAESPADTQVQKPVGSATVVEPEEPPTSPEPVPVRGAKKKSAQRPFRPSIRVPAGDAVSFPVDI